jgi:hypothetical protein
MGSGNKKTIIIIAGINDKIKTDNLSPLFTKLFIPGSKNINQIIRK